MYIYIYRVSKVGEVIELLPCWMLPPPKPGSIDNKSTLDAISRDGRFLSCGIILGFPLSCTDLFLYTITLPAVSCDAPPTLSYTTLELASRVLLSSKKPA